MSTRAKWKDKLRPATFRGVKFEVDSSTYGGGRRGVTHEFPGRDIPFREDTGRKARTYKVQAYLVGSDYLTRKNALIDALEKPGSGELIHPYFGRAKVCLEGEFSVEESSGTGGFVRISANFVEAGEEIFPKATADAQALLSAQSGLVDQVAQGELGGAMSVANQPQFVVDDATTKVGAFSDQLDSYTSGMTGSSSAVADFAFSVRDLKASAKDLVGKPGELGAKMGSSISFLEAAGNPSDVFGAVKGLWPFGSDDSAISRTTSTRETQANNRTALNVFVQTIAVTAGARAASQVTYASHEEATAARDEITAQIDKISETTTSDELYNAIQDLRAQVVRAIPAPDQTLARIAEVTPKATQPSIALAYELYESLELEPDLVSRNRISHPGFLPAGVSLEVLDRGE